MIEMKIPLRLSILAGASALALGLAAPVSAQTNTGTGAAGYGTTPGTSTNTPPKNAGDMNKLGEVGNTGTPAGAGTQTPTSGSYRASGAATTPGVAPNDATRQGTMGGSNAGTQTPTSGSYRASGAATTPGVAPNDATRQGTMGGGTAGTSAGTAGNLQIEQVRIEDLPPSLQQAVRSRMDRQQTPSELVETTILNRLALMGSDYKLNSARRDGSNYVLFVTNPSGQQATMLYETNSGNLREVQM